MRRNLRSPETVEQLAVPLTRAVPSAEQLLRIVEVQYEIISTRLSLAEVMQVVVDRAAQMTRADAGVVETPDGHEMVYRAATGSATQHVGLRIGASGSLSGMCARTGVTLRCDDAENDPRVDGAKCRKVGAVSMLCVPLRHGDAVVGVLKVYSARSYAFDDMDAGVLELLSGVIAAQLAHVAEFERLDMETRRSKDQALAGLRALARAIDAKDPSTRQHSDRVARTATALARQCGWSAERRQLLRDAAHLHDVGKIGVRDAILLKPGKLDDGEYAQVKQHAELGATIVEGMLSPEQISWIRGHHERPDGRGYPDGLLDAEIPDGAAIIALADAWDVMTMSRPYQDPMEMSAALHECRRLAGRQFREPLVEVLPEILVAEPELALV